VSTIREFELQAKIPKDSRYPKSLTTIGDHIRTKRLERNMEIKEAAELLGVTKQSIVHWEQGRTAPQIKHNDAITKFLGYQPKEVPEKRAENLQAIDAIEPLSFNL